MLLDKKMDVTTTLLLLAGAVAAAVPVTIAVAAYKGVFGTGKSQSTANSSVVSQIPTPAPSSTPTIVTQTTVSEPMKEETEVTLQPIQEAPAPFPEDSIPSSPVPTTSTTSVPTDITAIAGISSASTAGSPVLVIATPKRRRSAATKRLPSTATGTSPTPRKRRSSTKKQLQPEAVIATTTAAATIPEAPAESASASETSAAITTTAPQPSQQEV